jgi:flagellar motor switch protein FliM
MLSVLKPADIEAMVAASRKTKAGRPATHERSIQTCNFRSAGRLSNENARALTAIHETFARHLATQLDAYLGIGVEVKFKSLDQLPIKEHIAGIPTLSYIVPCSLRAAPGTMIVECDLDLVFPMIEVLMGGMGGSTNELRELSEIEEEIMLDVTALIARQAEQAWRFEAKALEPSRRVKPSVLPQYCAPNEKVTLAKFELEIAGTIGMLQLVFPAAFLTVLLSHIKADRPQSKSGVRYFPSRGIRERVLDCDFTVDAGLPNLKVAVKDLIALQPGSVLKLRAPVRFPGMLTVAGQELFEAAPVRNGVQKAAQLGRRTQRNDWGGQ